MQSTIDLAKIWSDEDLVELRVTVQSGPSSFSVDVYIGHDTLPDLINELAVFRNHVHGGLKDICFGRFGPEYAQGAFHARLHFKAPGRLYVSTHQQSAFSAFSVMDVASEAKMYLISEPVLLDNFIAELKNLASGSADSATLQCT